MGCVPILEDMNVRDKKVTIGLIQTEVTEDSAVNLRKTVEKVRGAAKGGARIICLQELFRTIYFPQYERLDSDRYSETIPGESTAVFSSLAEELGIVIIVPIYERTPDGNYYNSAAIIDADGSLMGKYRKTHIPSDPLFYEKNYFKEGCSVHHVYNTKYCKIGVLICYDQWFPEIARVSTLEGAEIIFYPTAIGWIKDYQPPEGNWHDAWETVQRAHAIANGVHVAAVNRVGKEGALKFWGGSFVCDSFGRVIKRAAIEDEEVLIVEVDLEMNRRMKEEWGFLRNRRPDTYQLICKGLKNDKGED
jgi:agmatine deiminase